MGLLRVLLFTVRGDSLIFLPLGNSIEDAEFVEVGEIEVDEYGEISELGVVTNGVVVVAVDDVLKTVLMKSFR